MNNEQQQQQQQQRGERMREAGERLRAERLGRVLKYLDRAMAEAEGEGCQAARLGRMTADVFCARTLVRHALEELGVDDD